VPRPVIDRAPRSSRSTSGNHRGALFERATEGIGFAVDEDEARCRGIARTAPVARAVAWRNWSVIAATVAERRRAHE